MGEDIELRGIFEEAELCAGDVILAAPAPSESEPESCCTRLLRLVPLAFRCKFDASIAFE